MARQPGGATRRPPGPCTHRCFWLVAGAAMRQSASTSLSLSKISMTSGSARGCNRSGVPTSRGAAAAAAGGRAGGSGGATAECRSSAAAAAAPAGASRRGELCGLAGELSASLSLSTTNRRLTLEAGRGGEALGGAGRISSSFSRDCSSAESTEEAGLAAAPASTPLAVPAMPPVGTSMAGHATQSSYGPSCAAQANIRRPRLLISCCPVAALLARLHSCTMP